MIWTDLDITRLECKVRIKRIKIGRGINLDITRLECKVWSSSIQPLHYNHLDITRLECKVIYREVSQWATSFGYNQIGM